MAPKMPCLSHSIWERKGLNEYLLNINTGLGPTCGIKWPLGNTRMEVLKNFLRKGTERKLARINKERKQAFIGSSDSAWCQD